MQKLILVLIMLMAVSHQAYSEELPTDAAQTCNPLKDNGDGTVTDPSNGLVWQRCAIGQTWEGEGCNDKSYANRINWFGAMKEAKANRYLGHTDWRLPTGAELQSITQKIPTCPNYLTTTNQLFSQLYNPSFWSTTPFGDLGYTSITLKGGASLVSDFKTSTLYSAPRTERVIQNNLGTLISFYGRLVRGGQLGGISEFEREYQRVLKAEDELKNVNQQQQVNENIQKQAEIKKQRENEARATTFQKNLQPGDKAKQGLVLAVNGKLIKIQATEYLCTRKYTHNNSCAGYEWITSEKWMQRSEVLPPN